MMIRLWAFLSMLPVLYVVRKIVRRQDISCFDILLSMHAVYFGLIPMFGDQTKLESFVREDEYATFMVSLTSFFFMFVLIFLDVIMTRKHPFLNITRYIRNWMTQHTYKKVTVWFLAVIVVVLWMINMYWTNVEIEIGGGSRADMREAQAEIQTPIMMIILSGQNILRLIFIFIYTTFFIQVKKKTVELNTGYLYLILAGFILWHLQISRTILLESAILAMLIIYAYYKDRLKRKDFIKAATTAVLVVLIGFPIVTGIRAIRLGMVYGGVSVSSMVDVLEKAYDAWSSNEIDLKELDNSSSRSWGCYASLAYAYQCDYEGYGELTINALTKGLPKAIFPWKSLTGSQLIIEKETHQNDDICDTFLLVGTMESRLLGIFIAGGYYVFLIGGFLLLYMFFCANFKNDMFVPLFISEVFLYLDQVEFTPDGLISVYINLIIWNLAFWAILKLSRLSLYNRNIL